jgi:hypothetical protein
MSDTLLATSLIQCLLSKNVFRMNRHVTFLQSIYVISSSVFEVSLRWSYQYPDSIIRLADFEFFLLLSRIF